MTRGRDANHIHTTPEVATGDAGPHPRTVHQGQDPIDLGPLENLTAYQSPAPGDMAEALKLLRRALETTGRERAARSLLDPAIQDVREQAFTAREASRRPPGYELESHRIHRDDLTGAHTARGRAAATVARLDARRADTMARLPDSSDHLDRIEQLLEGAYSSLQRCGSVVDLGYAETELARVALLRGDPGGALQ